MGRLTAKELSDKINDMTKENDLIGISMILASRDDKMSNIISLEFHGATRFSTKANAIESEDGRSGFDPEASVIQYHRTIGELSFLLGRIREYYMEVEQRLKEAKIILDAKEKKMENESRYN